MQIAMSEIKKTQKSNGDMKNKFILKMNTFQMWGHEIWDFKTVLAVLFKAFL